MARMGSFLLADEMGLGKSVQSLTVAAIDFERGFARRFIVIAPATLKWNWEAEIEEHTYFKCMVLDGTPAQRRSQLVDFEAMGYHCLIVNYEQVTAHLIELCKMGFEIAIWDEAHFLKNPKAKRTKSSLSLGQYVGRRFVLTGSPMLNQVNELWSLLHLIDPDEYPSYWQFVNRYCIYGGYKNKQIVGVKHKNELMTKLDSVMIRRLKKDVLDLPEKQHIPIVVELLPQQKKLYVEARDENQITLPGNATPMDVENALTRYLRFKEICATTHKFTGEDHSAKLDAAEDLCLEVLATGKPVVVFTQFLSVGDCLEKRLDKYHVKTFQIRGETPKHLRAAVVKEWEAYRDPKTKMPAVIVVMLQVGGVGLNMTAANTAIFVDKLYVPKLNEQAEDRIHRIGADKTQPIRIYQILAKGTVEARIETILKKKAALFSTIVDESEWKEALVKALQEGDDL